MDPQTLTTQIQPSPKPFPLLPVLLSLLILLLLSSTAFLAYQNIKLTKQIAALTKPILTPTPSPTPDPTANWKTFSASDWSFKYPSTLFAKEAEKNFIDLVDSENTPGSNARISIDARLMAPYLNDFTAASQRRTHDLNLINVQTTSIPNGVIISGTMGPGFGEGLKVTDGLIKYKNGAIAIQYNDSNVDPQIFLQILSTFKFLDNSTPSPTSTTYTCPPTGYVDCMPGNSIKSECSPAAISWYKINCPNFKGGAL